MENEVMVINKPSSFSRLKGILSNGGRTIRPLFKQSWVFIYIVAVLAAAQITLLHNAQAGVYVNAFAFLALVGLALRRESARQLAISAAILPVATMVVLALPAKTTDFTALVVYYDAILLLALVYRFMFTLDNPVQNSRLTLKGYGFVLPMMLVIGQALGTVGYLILRHHYPFDPQLSLMFVAATSVVFAVAEEMLFRGLIQQRGRLVLHPAVAGLLSATLFTIATIGQGSALVTIFAAISGLVLSTVYYFKQNLMLTIIVNAMSKVAYIALLATFVFN